MEMDRTAVYLTGKLVEVPQTAGYFHKQDGLTIQWPSIQEFVNDQEQCAKLCFTNKDCFAFSYCSSLVCALCLDDAHHTNQFGDRSPDLEYDWNRIQIISDDQCTLGKRLIGYREREHQSNQEILEELNRKIAKQTVSLVVVNEQFEDYELFASELQIQRSTGEYRRLQDGHFSAPNLVDQKASDGRLKYDDRPLTGLFIITHLNRSFDTPLLASLKDSSKQVLVHSAELSLSDCQLLCVNSDLCKSISYCRRDDSNECVLTTIANTRAAPEMTRTNSHCAVAESRF